MLPKAGDGLWAAERGIFSELGQKPEQKATALDRKIHEMFFPIDLREASVSLQNLWIFDECTSKEDLQRIFDMFKEGAQLEDEKNFERSAALIYNVFGENQRVAKPVKDNFHAALVLNRPHIYMIDMPELLVRLRIAHENTLEELQEVFDFVLNKVARVEGPI